MTSRTGWSLRSLSFLLLVSSLSACNNEPPVPQFSAPLMLGGTEVSADVLNQGARVYAMRCATCHGPAGGGDGPGARALKNKPRDFRAGTFKWKTTPGDELPTDRDLTRTVRGGRLEEGMPAWPAMSDEDLHAVVQYIKTFSPRWQHAAASASEARSSAAP